VPPGGPAPPAEAGGCPGSPAGVPEPCLPTRVPCSSLLEHIRAPPVQSGAWSPSWAEPRAGAAEGFITRPRESLPAISTWIVVCKHSAQNRWRAKRGVHLPPNPASSRAPPCSHAGQVGLARWPITAGGSRFGEECGNWILRGGFIGKRKAPRIAHGHNPAVLPPAKTLTCLPCRLCEWRSREAGAQWSRRRGVCRAGWRCMITSPSCAVDDSSATRITA